MYLGKKSACLETCVGESVFFNLYRFDYNHLGQANSSGPKMVWAGDRPL